MNTTNLQLEPNAGHFTEAARIVACVNACAKMDDPAKSILMAQSAMKAMIQHLHWLDGIEDLDETMAMKMKWLQQAYAAIGGA